MLKNFFIKSKTNIDSQKWGFDYVSSPLPALYRKLGASPSGLSAKEAKARLKKFGPNEPAKNESQNPLKNFLWRFTNPLVVLLFTVATFSLFFSDLISAAIIYLMAVMSVSMSFFQEQRAFKAAQKLISLVTTKAEVIRDKKSKNIPIKDLVPGDIVSLLAGNIIPADMRLIESNDLFVSQSSLTGESLPVEKNARRPAAGSIESPQLNNLIFMGSSVVSGTGSGLVIHTGEYTDFGKISKKLAETKIDTEFNKEIRGFTWLLIRSIIIVVTSILTINAIAKGNFLQTLIFALSVAIQISPETLPMVIAINLSRGSLDMAKKKVIVKRLSSIQDLGAMDILCTDKTGTLTLDHIVLQRHIDLSGNENDEVFKYGYANSALQTGLKNLLDQAVIKHTGSKPKQLKKLGEIPFDFNRKIISIIASLDGDKVMISKGAPEEIFKRCGFYEDNKKIMKISPALELKLRREYDSLSRDGFRVLALAYKKIAAGQKKFNYGDESQLILKGYMAFYDPPKPGAKETIQALGKAGIELKILTGDNELVAKKICEEIGLGNKGIIMGDRLESLDDIALSRLAETNTIFARVLPLQKERIIRVLHGNGHVVGFLGDGINDSPALKTADVGISVNNAVDIAKESAGMILLEKNLSILNAGVLEGRKVFNNFIKFIRTVSSFYAGYMITIIGSSLLLPFFAATPVQILLSNYFYDFFQITMPTDNVDDEDLKKPKIWSLPNIVKFMAIFGLINSFFDLIAFLAMRQIFGSWLNSGWYQTGWFLTTICFQMLAIYAIRTRKLPFVQSRPGRYLIIASLVIIALALLLPYTLAAPIFDLQQLPWKFFAILPLILAAYLCTVWAVKNWFVAKYEK